MTQYSSHWTTNVAVDTKRLARFGLLTVGVFLISFSLWATLFPLSSAVVAMGSIIPIGKSKTVQHPTGGTIVSIHAINGQEVKMGDLIVILDPVVDQAEFDNLRSRDSLLRATEARLVAQYHGRDTIKFPDDFLQKIDEQGNDSSRSSTIRYNELIADQKNELKANRQQSMKELSELEQQISSAKGQLQSLKNQRSNVVKERANVRKQLKRVQPLLKDGYFARSSADELERQLLEVNANLDGVRAQVTSLEFRINEVEDRKAATIAGRSAEVSNELSEVRGEIDSVKNEMIAAQDSLKKRHVRASADGIITKSAVNTIGGVISSGDVIAEIVPAGGYKIEARVTPQDIDYIQPEQSARVVVTAFNRTLNDPIAATVDYVSADSELDEQTGEVYFIARLILIESPTTLSQLNKLRAGMEGEVYISTGERTFLSYMMKPLSDGFRRAFQET